MALPTSEPEQKHYAASILHCLLSLCPQRDNCLLNPAHISSAAPGTVIYALTLRAPTYTVSHSYAHIYVMQFTRCFLRKKHLLRKHPLRANKDKGQFASGAIKGSCLSPLALQSVLECFLHVGCTKQGEGVAFLPCFSSWEMSQLSAVTHVTPVPPGPGEGQAGGSGCRAAGARQAENTEISIPLGCRANEQLPLPRTAFPGSPEV